MGRKITPQEEEFLNVLKEIDRTPQEQAKKAMTAVVAIDHQLVAAVEARYGPQKAIEMHRKKWAPVLDQAFKEAKDVLGIDKVDDLDKLVRIRMYLNDQTPCPSKIIEEPGKATMTVLACPFIQVAREVFKENLASTWLRAAASSERWAYERLVEWAGLKDKVNVVADKFACMDAKFKVCRGIFAWKGVLPESMKSLDPSTYEPSATTAEKFGDARDLTLDEVLDYCMAVTNKDPVEQAIHSTKAQYAAVYLTWKCLYNEFGPEIAKELYWECWKQLLVMSYQNAVKKLGIEKPKTARDIGRIHLEFLKDAGLRTEVVKDTEDEWIIHILWCPNPELGPADNHALRMKYYRTEYELSVWVNEYLIRLAGLENKVEHEHPTSYCAHADESYCTMIYRKKR